MAQWFFITLNVRDSARPITLLVETTHADLSELRAAWDRAGDFWIAREWESSARDGERHWFKRETMVAVASIALASPIHCPIGEAVQQPVRLAEVVPFAEDAA